MYRPFRSFLWLPLLCIGVMLPSTACAQEYASLIIERGQKDIARFQVEIAQDNESRMRGLMFREHLDADKGMLFIHHPPQVAAMWMKDTRIPLDMLFIDSRRRILYIHANATPYSLTPITAGKPVWAVLEIAGGRSKELGIRHGDTVLVKD